VAIDRLRVRRRRDLRDVSLRICCLSFTEFQKMGQYLDPLNHGFARAEIGSCPDCKGEKHFCYLHAAIFSTINHLGHDQCNRERRLASDVGPFMTQSLILSFGADGRFAGMVVAELVRRGLP